MEPQRQVHVLNRRFPSLRFPLAHTSPVEHRRRCVTERSSRELQQRDRRRQVPTTTESTAPSMRPGFPVPIPTDSGTASVAGKAVERLKIRRARAGWVRFVDARFSVFGGPSCYALQARFPETDSQIRSVILGVARPPAFGTTRLSHSCFSAMTQTWGKYYSGCEASHR